MIQLGLISDTHGLLRPEVVERLRTCDAILHAGDINRPEILDALRAIAPLCVRRVRVGEYKPEDNVLFLHTGGAGGLFAQDWENAN